MKLFSGPVLTGLIILIASNFILAQTRQKPATVTLLDGSSSSGMVVYKNWEESPSSFSYRKNGTGNWLKLDTTNLRSLRIDDASAQVLFENHKIRVETTQLSTAKIFTKRIPEYENRQVMLRCLVKGKTSLYSADFGFSNVFYVGKDDETPFLLINRSFEENFRVYTDASFRRQIADSLKNCVDSVKALRLQYSSQSLIHVVENCNNTKSSFSQYSKKVKTRFGIIGGVNTSTIKYFERNDINPPAALMLDTKPGLHIGAFADIAVSRNVKKMSVYIEGTYTTLSGTKSAQFRDDLIHTYDVSLGYLKVSTLARYTFPSQKFFVNAGITNSMAIKTKQTDSYDFFSQHNVNPIYPEIRRYSQGLAGGFGFLYHRIGIEARYETATGISPYSIRNNKLQFFYGLLSYSF